MLKKLLIALIFLSSMLMGYAQPGEGLLKKQPKLVVGVVVDHFRAEYLYDFWENFRNDGFRKLIDQGALCSNVALPIHNINSVTGLATAYTGTYPNKHGLVGHEWYNQVARQMIHCVKDPDYITLGSDSEEGNCSAMRLKALTISDLLRINSNFKSKVFSVSLNAETAVLSAGHSANGAYWLDTETGNFITSSYYMPKFPRWLFDYNKQMYSAKLLEQNWDLLLPKGSYSNGYKDNYVLEKGFWNRFNTFPYNMAKMGASTTGYHLLKATPWGNKMVREVGQMIVEEENLGDDGYTDLLTLHFSSLDFANKWFEPRSMEMQDMYLRMDKEIASLIQYLDREIGKNQYLVFLIGSSGSSYSVDVQKEEFKFEAGNFSPKSALALLRSYLNALYGIGEWIIDYSEEQIYLNHDLIRNKELSIIDMQDKVANFLNQFEGIANCLPGHLIEKGIISEKGMVKFTNSYCTKRSGDVLILLENGWKPSYKNQEIFYTDYPRVPLVFYGANIRPAIISKPHQLIDFGPTICRMLNMLPPEKSDGEIIEGVIW